MNFVKEEAIVRSDLLLSTIIILLRMNVRKDYTLAHCGYILVERTKTYLIKLKHTAEKLCYNGGVGDIAFTYTIHRV